MDVKEFVELFIRELEINGDLRAYYRLINNKSRYLWRKAYFEQRLTYVNDHLGSPSGEIWDVGCGYGTTAIFLTLNGYNVHGNTLEFYYDKIGKRLDYWSQYGDLSGLKVEYANLFDMPVQEHYYDLVIAQDTLHHLEPINEALDIFSKSLKQGGKLIVTEENGLSLFIRMKNFSKRGFKRVSEYYDEQLGKSILFGNENARSLQVWRNLLRDHGFNVENTEYIRFFPHFFYSGENYRLMQDKERRASKNLPIIRDFLFFGINFTAKQNK